MKKIIKKKVKMVEKEVPIQTEKRMPMRKMKSKSGMPRMQS